MTELTEKLTPGQRRRGQRRYLWFARLNGASIACLAENMLILYALSVGLRETMVGVLASFLHITMPFMLLGKGFVARFGAARCIGWMWVGRNLCGIGMAAAPFLGLLGGSWLVPNAVLAFAFLFCAFRAMGMVGLNPLIAEISDEKSQGRLSARNFSNFTAFHLLTMLVLVAVMRLGGSTGTFQIILLSGALIGLVSSFTVMGVPETSVLRKSATLPIGQSVLKVLHRRPMRKLLLAHVGGFALLTALPPMTMAAAKKGYGISDADALFLVLIQLVGGIVGAFLSQIISERSGPRPLLIIAALILTSTAGMWSLAPSELHVGFIFTVFFSTGFSALMLVLSLTHCFIALTPASLRLPGGLLVSFGAGAGSAIAGFVVASGGIATLKDSLGFTGLELYDMYFRLVIPFALVCVGLVAQVEGIRDWRVGRVMGLFFSPRDLRALFTLSRMEEFSGPVEDRRTVESLGSSKSPLSESSILDLVDSPDFTIRARTINALRQLDYLGETARAALIRELREKPYTTAYLAAEVIGENNITEAIPDLLNALKSDDVYLVGKSMVALARLQAEDGKPKIAEILQLTDNPRLVIHAALALAEYDDPNFAPLLFRKSLNAELPKRSGTKFYTRSDGSRIAATRSIAI